MVQELKQEQAAAGVGKTDKQDLPEAAGINDQASPGATALKSELRGMPFEAQTQKLAPVDGPAPTGGAPQATTHVVKAGETLSTIARSALGNASLWRELYAWNKALIGANPNALKVGMKLSLSPGGGEVKTDPGGEVKTDPGGEVKGGDVSTTTQSTDKDVKTGGTSPDKAGEAGPGYPHLVFMRGPTTTKGHLGWAESVVKAAMERWGATGSPRVTYHAVKGGDPVIAIEWVSSWGALPATTDLKNDLRPIEARLAVKAMEGLAGFGGLDAGKQDRLRAMVGGETNNLSSVARGQFGRMLNTDKIATKSEAEQAEALQKFIGSPDAIPGLVGAEGDTYKPDPWTIKGPEAAGEYAFRAGKVEADKWVVTSGGHTLTVYGPKAPDPTQGHLHTAEQAAEAWAALPEKARRVVHTIALNPMPNPDDAYWAVTYGTPNFRSYMTAGASGVIDVYPMAHLGSQAGFTSKVIHEAGHVMSFQDWGHNTKGEKWKPWLGAMASDGTSLSRYAQNDPAEDLAETVEAYIHTKGAPQHAEYREIVPARFKVLDDYLK